MWVVGKSIIEILNGFMNHGMVYQVVLKVVKLLAGWELTIDEKTSGFDEGTFFGDLFDGITPV
jgi:hypothetical protein